jgi:hypothetical protein
MSIASFWRTWQRQALTTLGLLVATLVLLFLQTPGFGPAFIQRNGAYEPVTLPFRTFPPRPEAYQLRVTVRSPWIGPTLVRMTPDDCVTKLSLNQRPIGLGGIDDKCDYNFGFVIELPTRRGENVLDIAVENRGGAGGLELSPAYAGMGRACGAGAVAFLLALIFALARGLGLTPMARVAAVAGLLLRVVYMSQTPWFVRAHDVDGHLEYVQRMLNRFVVPKIDACWECYHPPTYFGFAAIWVRVAQALRVPMTPALQWLALSCSSVFLLLGLAAVQTALAVARPARRSVVVTTLAAFLFALWPAAIVHAPRLGNDPPFYALAAVSTALMFIWWQDRRTPFAVASLVVAGFATLTKSSGFALVAANCIVVFVGVVTENDRSERSRDWRTLIVSAIAAIVSVAPPLVLALVRSRLTGRDVLVSNISDTNRGLLVANTATTYLYAPAHIWFEQPFTDPWHDDKGRGYYWTYLGKTSLFGEFDLGADPTRRAIAVVLSVLLLVLVALLIRALVRATRADALWAVPLFVWIAASAAFRARYPVAPSADFRYVLPVLIPLCVGIARGLEDIQNIKVSLLSGTSVVAFTVLSCILYATIGLP